MSKELSWERKDRTVLWEPIRFSRGALENDISATSNNLLNSQSVPVMKRKELLGAESSASWKWTSGGPGTMAGLQARQVTGLEAVPTPGFHCSIAFSRWGWKISARVLLVEKLQIIITNLLFQIKSH